MPLRSGNVHHRWQILHPHLKYPLHSFLKCLPLPHQSRSRPLWLLLPQPPYTHPENPSLPLLSLPLLPETAVTASLKIHQYFFIKFRHDPSPFLLIHLIISTVHHSLLSGYYSRFKNLQQNLIQVITMFSGRKAHHSPNRAGMYMLLPTLRSPWHFPPHNCKQPISEVRYHFRYHRIPSFPAA